MSYNPRNTGVLPAEKLISVLSYFTFGTVGFIWIIVGALMKQTLRPFLRYHLYQSLFLAILFFIVSQALILIVNLLAMVPYVNIAVGAISFFFNVTIINLPFLHLSIVQLFLLSLVSYLSFGVLKGQYSYIPWVSDIIKYNVGR